MVKDKVEKELYDQLVDLLNNYSCSCVGTRHCPCPRCQVSIELSRDLLKALKKQVLK